MVISVNLFYLDAIDDIVFERNVSGNSSDTLPEEESFAGQQKKANRKIQPGSVKQKKKYGQNKQNTTRKRKEFRQWFFRGRSLCEQSRDEGNVECIICNNYKFKFRIQHLTIAFVPNYSKIKLKSVACGAWY